MLNSLRKYLNSKTVWVKCGGFKCNNVFQIMDSSCKPNIYICKTCEDKINEGIIQYIHAHTGKIKGNFHILSGYSRG